MAEHHPAREELTWYATDGVAVALRGWPAERVVRADRIEAHVAGCARCSEALAAEAEIELALAEVARDSGGGTPAPRSLLAWLGGAAAAAALAFALAFGGSPGGGETPAAPAAVSGADAGVVELAFDGSLEQSEARPP